MNRTLSTVLDFLLITAAATAVAVGVSSFMPANAQVYGFEVIKYGIADRTVELIKYGIADKTVHVRGGCSGTVGLPTIELIEYGIADETWEVIEYGIADMDICLSGDIDEWFEHVK